MTHFESRTASAALAACSLTAVLALAGCSAGQIAQTAMQQPALNGTQTYVGGSTTGIALRNLYLRAEQTSDYVRPGSDVDLIFVAVNESPDQDDRLVSISSDVGTVSLTGDLEVPAAGTLVVGTPDGQPSPLDALQGADTAEATVALTEEITNGLTYPFTFTFERSGEAEILVPISAGEAPRRDSSASEVDAEAEAEGGG